MKQQMLDTCTLDGLENIVSFLKSYNIKSKCVDFDKYNYSRTIEFTVNEQTYQICWFNNESKLKIGTHKRASFVVFKYIYFDNCFPIAGGNENLGFSYTKKEKTNRYDSDFNYYDFRLPL